MTSLPEALIDRHQTLIRVVIPDLTFALCTLMTLAWLCDPVMVFISKPKNSISVGQNVVPSLYGYLKQSYDAQKDDKHIYLYGFCTIVSAPWLVLILIVVLLVGQILGPELVTSLVVQVLLTLCLLELGELCMMTLFGSRGKPLYNEHPKD